MVWDSARTPAGVSLAAAGGWGVVSAVDVAAPEFALAQRRLAGVVSAVVLEVAVVGGLAGDAARDLPG